MAGNGGDPFRTDPFNVNMLPEMSGSQGTAGSLPGFPSASPHPGGTALGTVNNTLYNTDVYHAYRKVMEMAMQQFPQHADALGRCHNYFSNGAKKMIYNTASFHSFMGGVIPQLANATGLDVNDPQLAQLKKELTEGVAALTKKFSGGVPVQPAPGTVAYQQLLQQQHQQQMIQQQQFLQHQQKVQNLTPAQQQHYMLAVQQGQFQPQAMSQPQSQPQSQPTDPPAAAKPPRAPKAGAKRAAADGDTTEASAPKPKRAKAPAAPRRKKGAAGGADSDGGPGTSAAADADDGEKLTLGGEVIDLAAETDAGVDAVERVRARQLPTEARAWDDGFQFLSAWRLTNEALAQRREKMPGAAGSSAEQAAEFVSPAVLRALQLGFAAHTAEVLRRAAAAAKHRASSFAAPRRPEFAASGADARRGLGEIRRAAEKAAADRAERDRQDLMRAAASKRADDETRALAQKAKAEMVGEMQAKAANKALAATMGGRDAKWSKWGGGGSSAGDEGKGKGKGKGKAGGAAGAAGAGPESGAEGDEGGKGGMAASRSRADLGTTAPAGGAAPGSMAGEGSTDVQIQDLVVALQQDPLYCKSTLLYRMMNGMV